MLKAVQYDASYISLPVLSDKTLLLFNFLDFLAP